MTDFNILVGGEAGQGIQSIGIIIARMMARGGYSVFADQDYESRVRGGHNFFRIRVSDNAVRAVAEKLDVLVALNREFGQYYQAAIDTPLSVPGQPGGWMVQAMYFSMGQRHDYREALKAVTAPVLVIHGAVDLQPEAATRLYVQAFPNARFQLIDEAGHFSFLEQPDVFARTVGEFLAELN